MKKGWEFKALGEICTLRPPKSEARDRLGANDPVSFVPMSELGINQKYFVAKETTPLSKVADSYTYFADGDVLLAKITPCFENGKLGIADGLTNGVGFGSSEFFVIRPNHALDKEFLYYFLSQPAVRQEGQRCMGGAVGQQRVPKEYLESLTVPLPPLPEQRRIVATLDEAFEGIAAAKANAEKSLRNAKEVFETTLNDGLRKAAQNGHTSRIGDIVTRLTNGYVGPTRSIYIDSGVPYLLARHVRENALQFDGKTYVSDAFNKKHSKSMLREGDVLLVQSGHIGHSAVVPKDHEGHNCHAMIVISTKPGTVSGEFLSLVFNSSRMRQTFWKIRSGSTVPHLTCKAVKELDIPVPPADVQSLLVAQAKALRTEADRLEDATERKVVLLDELKATLLHQAFSGDL